jgi:hypothetical protein
MAKESTSHADGKRHRAGKPARTVAHMSDYSPAPWVPETYTEGDIRLGERLKAANGLVIVKEVWGASISECDANMRLIAAAPDLLNACKFFFQALETGKLVRDISQDAKTDWALKMIEFMRDLGKAQAAIFKAEGR